MNPRNSDYPHIFTGYLLSVSLVLIYVNMFPVVKYVVHRWGTIPVLILPLLITITALVAIFFFCLHRKRIGLVPTKTLPVIAGIVICLIALAVPDPQVPIKRIHVIEYMLLSLVVRYTMSFRLQNLALLFFSIFFSSLLGIHDELLQGLHPLRTYGLRDIAVNTLGSAGGALIWYGFHLFVRPLEVAVCDSPRSNNPAVLYLFLLTVSVTILFIPLYQYRKDSLPLWPALPLFFSFIFFSTKLQSFPLHWKHGIIAISLISFFMGIYPLIANFTDLVFF